MTAEPNVFVLPTEHAVSELKKSNGRKMGDHGNRATPAMRESVLAELRRLQETTGVVSHAAIAAEAVRAGVHQRTVQRWWQTDQDRRISELVDPDRLTCSDEEDRLAAVEEVPAPLRRYANSRSGAVELTLSEMKFFARQPSTQMAITAIKEIPGHRLAGYARSTLYEAYKSSTHAAVRKGARKGASAQRAEEMGTPIVRTSLVNDLWSIDEYDLKTVSLDPYGNECRPKVLIVRDVYSDVALASSVLYSAATEEDTLRVVGAAILGFDTGEVSVGGAARLLRSDQGAAFLSDTVVQSLEYVGMSIDATESYSPRANGDHENIHKGLAYHFTGGTGSRRGWEDRAGTVEDHGVLPFEECVSRVRAWQDEHNNRVITKGRLKGCVPLEVYREACDEGRRNAYEPGEEDLARLAPIVGERKIDASRGLFLDGSYFVSRSLASASETGMRVTLRQLLDPDTAYAFNRHGVFLGTVYRDSTVPDEETAGIVEDRSRREKFVSRGVGKAKGAAARADSEAMRIAAAAGEEATSPGAAPAPEVPLVGTSEDLREIAARFKPAAEVSESEADDAV